VVIFYGIDILKLIPFLALILSVIATYLSITTRINSQSVEKSLKALHRRDVLKRAEKVFEALHGLKDKLEPKLLLDAPREYILSHDLLARCFSRSEQDKIVESWEMFNHYMEEYWIDEKGEFQTLRKLGWNDIGKISLDKSENEKGNHGSTMESFEELIKILNKQ
jgi:hypothetical protein